MGDDEDSIHSWNQIEQRMAFYGGICRHGKIVVPIALAQQWRAALPSAIEREYRRIASGELPRRLTLEVVLSEDSGANGENTTSAPERPTSAR